MGDYTPRRGFYKAGLTDPVAVQDDWNNALDILDAYGAFLDTTGVWTAVQTFAPGQFAVPVAVTPDAAAALGTGTTLAASDHQHGMATYTSTPAVWTQAGSAGTLGTAPARGDHAHPVSVSTNTPVASAIAGSAGTTNGSRKPSADDHVHPLALTPLAAITANVTSTNTTELVVVNNQFTAGYLSAGLTIGIKATGTLSASAAGTLNARMRAGANGTTADTQVCATGATGSVTTAVGVYLDAQLTVRSVGSTGTVVGNIMLIVGTAIGLSAQTATVTVNTNPGTPFLNLTLQNGGTSPSLTIVTASIHIMRG